MKGSVFMQEKEILKNKDFYVVRYFKDREYRNSFNPDFYFTDTMEKAEELANDILNRYDTIEASDLDLLNIEKYEIKDESINSFDELASKFEGSQEDIYGYYYGDEEIETNELFQLKADKSLIYHGMLASNPSWNDYIEEDRKMGENIEDLKDLLEDYINIDGEQLKDYLKSLEENTLNKLNQIKEMIEESCFKYALVKNSEQLNSNVNENFIEQNIDDINKSTEQLLELEDKMITEEKYIEIAKLILESLKSMLEEMIRDFKIELQILKEKVLNKNVEEQPINDNQEEVKNELKLDLTENDKIKMANIKDMPQSVLEVLAKEENIMILRRLATNENLPKESFIELAKNKDLKLKELLLENDKLPTEALEILLNDKDKFIRLETIKHKNMPSEKLEYLYNKNIKNDEIIGCIVRNRNASSDLVEKISNNLETTNENRKMAFRNKNHPINNKFIIPEMSKEKSNELYQKLVFQSDIRKNELLEMFKNEKLYADEKGNAIFPIKDNNNEVVGAYKIDFSKNERPELLENSSTREEYLHSASNLSNKIFKSLNQEEVIEQTEEMEI